MAEQGDVDRPSSSRWLPLEEIAERTLVGAILDTRHCGRFLFFAGFAEEEGAADAPASSATHQLLFRSTSSHGRMEDDALRWFKRRLRPGDRISVTIHAIERAANAAADEPPLCHVTNVVLLDLSIRSNTGVERTCAAMSQEEQQQQSLAGGTQNQADRREDAAEEHPPYKARKTTTTTSQPPNDAAPAEQVIVT